MIQDAFQHFEDNYTPYSERKNSSFEVQRIMVGVTGGSAAGKTTLCESIKHEMEFDTDFDMAIIPLDAFYKGIDKTKVNIAEYNFDHPDALDFDLAHSILTTLLSGRPAYLPVYDFVTHCRTDKTILVMPTSVLFFEGILALYDERIRNLMQYKIFLHCDDDIRLCRRIIRDVKERGREVPGIIYQYNKFVKVCFESFVKPTMNYSDIIVPGSRDNQVAVSFIVQHLKNISKQLGILKQKLGNMLYFGDLLYTIDNLIQNSRTAIESVMEVLFKNTPYRKIIFPMDESTKSDIFFQIQFMLTQKPFTQKQYYKSIKVMHKNCLMLLEKALNFKKIELKDVQCLKLQDLYVKDDVNEEFLERTELKKYILITLPYLFKDQFAILLEVADHFQRVKPECKLLVVNLFSSINQVTCLDQMKNLQFIVNALLVGKQEKFLQALKKCSDKELREISDTFFESNRFMKKMERFINKRLGK